MEGWMMKPLVTKALANWVFLGVEQTNKISRWRLLWAVLWRTMRRDVIKTRGKVVASTRKFL